jgi:homogentisate 1,2-dioxygenase
VRTITTGGDVNTQTGLGHSVYSITSSMVDAYFDNSDAEMLFVFEHGNVRFWTEFGIIDVEPSEIVVIPRGVKLRVEVHTLREAQHHLLDIRRQV